MPAVNSSAATLGQLQNISNTVNTLAAANGVTTGTTTGGAGTTAAPVAGTTTTPAAGQQQGPTVVGTFPNATGQQLVVLKDQIGQFKLQNPTGKLEVVNVAGKPIRFSANGQMITAFQQIEGYGFKINLDYREGIATGLANLSRIFGARQERVRLMSNALADDANDTGSFNPVDLQKMSLETTTTQQLSEMQKKIFDSMRDSIQAWLR